MIAMLVVLTCLAYAFYATTKLEHAGAPMDSRVGSRLERLWDVAQQGLKERKYLRAEKALLTILKLDEKNAAAYNRLGILYSRQKEYKDAIECFEIASSIEPSASSLHNLGLIYYETENYEKAEVAFQSAIKLEEGMAARHIAYAKVLEKLGRIDAMIVELEEAVRLEPNPQSLQLLADSYVTVGRNNEAVKILSKKERLVLPAGRSNRIKQSNKAVY